MGPMGLEAAKLAGCRASEHGERRQGQVRDKPRRRQLHLRIGNPDDPYRMTVTSVHVARSGAPSSPRRQAPPGELSPPGAPPRRTLPPDRPPAGPSARKPHPRVRPRTPPEPPAPPPPPVAIEAPSSDVAHRAGIYGPPMRPAADPLSTTLFALADPTRRALLAWLA